MATNKKSVLIYVEWISIFEELSDDEAGRLIKHFFSYINDLNPEAPDRLTMLLFEPIKQQLIHSKQLRKCDEFHWNWKGGISPINQVVRNCLQMKYWRISVFERDGYTCQICSTKGGVLNAHHIKKFSNFPDLRFDISNGMTLCKKCHINIHSTKDK